MEITEITLPIALVFPNSSHRPVTFACRCDHAWNDARSRACTLKTIKYQRLMIVRDGTHQAVEVAHTPPLDPRHYPSTSDTSLLCDRVSSDLVTANDAPLGIGRESSGVAGEWKYILIRDGGGGITEGAGISDVDCSSGNSVSTSVIVGAAFRSNAPSPFTAAASEWSCKLIYEFN